MSFGMGIMENKVHKESSKVSSSSNSSNVSEEKLGGNSIYNNTASTRLLKFKRRQVFAVRDFPPGCGSFAMRLRSSKTSSEEEKLNPYQLKSVDEQQKCNDMVVAATAGVESNGVNKPESEPVAVRDFPPGCGSFAMRLRSPRTEANNDGNVESSEAKEEEKLIPDQFRSVDEQQKCTDMVVAVTAGVESNGVNKPESEPTKENSEPVVVQPLSTMPKDEDDVPVTARVESNGVNISEPETMKEGSDELMLAPEGGNSPEEIEPVEAQALSICLPDGGGSIVRTKQFHGRKVSETERDMVVFTDEEQSLGREHLDQSRVQSTKPKQRKAKKGFPVHAPLKVNMVTIRREYGEGSKMKNSGERNRKRASPDTEDSSPDRKHRKTLEVGLPPSRPGGSSGGGDSMRNKVKECLRLFHGLCRKLMQEEEAKPKLQKKKNFRVDYEASKILKSKGIFPKSANQVMGSVPGVEVGDEFQFRMELNLLGIHKPSQGGIDSMKVGDENLATSIVCSGGYDDDLDNPDVLTYTGQGGNVMNKVSKKGEEKKEPEDQKLITGNLALANSVKAKNPVRVIKGHKKAVLESSGDNKRRNYVYDGLYVVEEFWQETGSHGKLVFKYKLRRIPGQPELSWRVVKQSKKSQNRPGLCRLDISEGRERLPISAINEIDDEKPPSFIYTAEMIYPDWCRPVPPKGCSCTSRCRETKKCVCVARNGGEILYNYDGAIVSAKNLIYECGPLCKCPPSCYLRVTQRGIRFQLEIFKTESRGWGVRSLSSISPGSFICEYVGELLEDKEAERRTGNDEYLFDIGNKYENPLAEGMSKLMPEKRSSMEEEDDEDMSGGFTIDAARKGNVGRFINHSCSPNLYAQNVLYDHEDARIPHVMFFAMDNIPPLQELTYHYNYMIDQVRDCNGNIKKKICYCGSSDCTGRLY